MYLCTYENQDETICSRKWQVLYVPEVASLGVPGVPWQILSNFYHLILLCMVPSVLEFKKWFNRFQCLPVSSYKFFSFKIIYRLRPEVAPYNAFIRTVKCCKINNRFQLTFGISIKSWFEWIFDYKSVRCDLTEFSEFRERLKKWTEVSRN